MILIDNYLWSMSLKNQNDWTEEERKKLDELARLVPKSLAEELVSFQRLGLKPPPKPKGLCLKDEEYDRYPNLSGDRLEHVEECLVCGTMIRSLPTLAKLQPKERAGLLQKLRRFFS